MNEIISYGRFRCEELAPHKNRGMEITYIEKGMLEWMVEGRPERIEPHSIFFTLPWQVHGSMNPAEPANTIYHVLFHLEADYPAPRNAFQFPESFGFSDEEMNILSSAFCSSPSHCFAATPTLRHLMPTLIAELESTHELREAQSITLLRAVLVELKRILTDEGFDTGRYTPSEQRVQRMIAGLPGRCDEHWTLSSMADECGIQRTQLNRIFQKLTGSTPMEYLFRLRMERAKTLLRETDIKIIDLALECGYCTSQYFANVFRQATGSTPSQYRRLSGRLSAAESANWKNIRFRSEEEERRRVREFSHEPQQDDR